MKFSPTNQVYFIPNLDLTYALSGRTCYGDPMPEMEPTVFVSFMKVVATLCLCAMVVSVWPGSDD